MGVATGRRAGIMFIPGRINVCIAVPRAMAVATGVRMESMRCRRKASAGIAGVQVMVNAITARAAHTHADAADPRC